MAAQVVPLPSAHEDGPRTPESWVFMLWELHYHFLSHSCI